MGTRPLTERQEAIVRMLAAGKRDKQIADVLNLNVATVRAAILRLVDATGAKTRCQAVALYVKQEEEEDG